MEIPERLNVKLPSLVMTKFSYVDSENMEQLFIFDNGQVGRYVTSFKDFIKETKNDIKFLKTVHKLKTSPTTTAVEDINKSIDLLNEARIEQQKEPIPTFHIKKPKVPNYIN